MSVHPVHEAIASKYVKKQFKNKALQLIHRREFKGADLNDLQQELMFHVLKEAHLFDPARGEVIPFIAQVVKSAIAMMCRDRKRLKRERVRPLSLESTTVPYQDREAPIQEILLEDDLHRHRGEYSMPDLEHGQMAADISGVLSDLAPDLQAAAGLMMDGRSEVEISRRLSISRRQVRKAISVIRDRLIKAGFSGNPDSRPADGINRKIEGGNGPYEGTNADEHEEFEI